MSIVLTILHGLALLFIIGGTAYALSRSRRFYNGLIIAILGLALAGISTIIG